MEVKSYSKNHIDAEVCLNGGDVRWRFTGFYGVPERSRRRDSWNLLKRLSSLNHLPWVVMGDFNDILNPEEKRGGHPQPRRLIDGFREAAEVSGLKDLGFDGYQYTWERSRGTPNWVEAKLDRVLASDSWSEQFNEARAASVIATKSDHLPIHLQIFSIDSRKYKTRFRFENLWLKESLCREVMIQSWTNTQGQHLLDRIGRCGKAIWNWGKSFAKDFQKRIVY